MKILVTGATGYIGRYLVKTLLEKGHSVVILCRSLEKARKFEWFKCVESYEYNLMHSLQKLPGELSGIDRVIHLAWANVQDIESIEHLESVHYHYLFIKQLLDGGVNNITVAGTCLEYGMQNGCLDETLITNPIVSYGIAKDSLRKYLEILQTKQTDVFVLKWARIFYMHGGRQHKHSLLSELDVAIANNDKKFRMSKGEQLRDYLHVRDVSQYLVQIALHGSFTGVTNCCSGVPVSVRTFVERYIQEKGAKLSLDLGHYPYRSYEPLAFWGDTTKLNNILNT